MLNTNPLQKTALKLSIAMLLCSPVFAASVVGDASNGISNATSTVKDAAKKTGKAIEKAADDIGEAASDTAITTKIKAKLAVESDVPLDTSVTTKSGVVYLGGNVDTQLQADRIIEIAESVDDVKAVNSDKLKITSSESYFSDAAITMKTKSRISDLSSDHKIAPGSDLHVETTNGIVHVYGTVSSAADIATLKKEISSIDGVNKVSVNINVVSKKQ